LGGLKQDVIFHFGNRMMYRLNQHKQIRNRTKAICIVRSLLPTLAIFVLQLVIINSVGQEIERLVDGEQPAGQHTVAWSANGHASGTYFYRRRAGSFEETKRMALVR